MTDEALRRGLDLMVPAVFGSTVTAGRVRTLRGGLDATTVVVALSNGTHIVVKRQLREGDGDVDAEAARLEAASSVPVPTPAVLAVDAAGEWFGRPALVLSRLPGRHLGRQGPGRWTGDLAAALAAIHATTVPAPPKPLHDPHAGIDWRAADHAEQRGLRTHALRSAVEVAVGLQRDLAAEPPPNVLLHHDFHTGNVLWQRGRLTGVVDWAEARLGPAACDVAYCSMCLAISYDLNASDAFVGSYRHLAGDVEDLVRWRLLWATVAARWLPLWSTADAGRDLPENTTPVMRRRLKLLVGRDLARAC